MPPPDPVPPDPETFLRRFILAEALGTPRWRGPFRPQAGPGRRPPDDGLPSFLRPPRER
jgi:hypothetical protein